MIKSISKLSQQIEKQSSDEQGHVPDVSMIESHLSSDESMDILEEKEESVGILASSDISSTSTKSSSGKSSSRATLNITDPNGRIDIDKIWSWSIPKICKHKRTHSGSHIRGGTRTSPKLSQSRSEPKAHSTPHLQEVQSSRPSTGETEQ